MPLPRTIVALGVVSLLTDLSSEMIYPLLPAFLATVLLAGPISLGWIEGVAESTAALFKLISGVVTDRWGKRKPLVLFGYTLSGLMRPLVGLANSWGFVLVIRFADRIGKGIRTSPRDALIADTTDLRHRGRAYGLHRAMDHAGAVLGPLIAWVLLEFFKVEMRNVFFLAAVPALLGVWVILQFVKAPKVEDSSLRASMNIEEDHGKSEEAAGRNGEVGAGDWKSVLKIRKFRILLLGLLIFTLGNATDAFLLWRLQEAGFTAGRLSLIWAVHSAIKMFAVYYGGKWVDRVGTRRLLFGGWLYFALVFAGMAWLESSVAVTILFLLYGLYFGLVEPSERALVAKLVPTHLRGSAFGLFHFTIGLAALPSSLLFGWIYQAFGAPAAFTYGSVCAVLAVLLVSPIRPNSAGLSAQ